MNGKVERNDLSDRVAIVTGGAGLLGSDYCRTLSAAGAHVCIADVESEAANALAVSITESSGASAIAHRTDVSDASSVRACVTATMDKFGRVDILVNNAAINPKFDRDHADAHLDTFENFPLKAWQESLDVNVTGMFLCAQAVSEPMLQAGTGVIVNISSTYGMVGPDQRLYQREGMSPTYKPVTYTVSKAAAIGLTRYLATYFAGKATQSSKDKNTFTFKHSSRKHSLKDSMNRRSVGFPSQSIKEGNPGGTQHQSQGDQGQDYMIAIKKLNQENFKWNQMID